MKEFGKVGRISLTAVLGLCVVALLIFSHYSSQGRVRNGENIARIRQKVQDIESIREKAKQEAEERRWKIVKVWKMVPLSLMKMSKEIEEAAHEKNIDFEALQKKKFPKDMQLASWCLPSDGTKLEERGDTLFVSSPNEFMLALASFKPEKKKYRFYAEFDGRGSVSFSYFLRRKGVAKAVSKQFDFSVFGMKTRAELIVPAQDFYHSCRFEMRLSGELTCKELILQEEIPEAEDVSESQKP